MRWIWRTTRRKTRKTMTTTTLLFPCDKWDNRVIEILSTRRRDTRVIRRVWSCFIDERCMNRKNVVTIVICARFRSLYWVETIFPGYSTLLLRHNTSFSLTPSRCLSVSLSLFISLFIPRYLYYTLLNLYYIPCYITPTELHTHALLRCSE